MIISGNVNGRQMQTTADGETAALDRSPEEVKKDQENQKKKSGTIYAGDLQLNRAGDRVAEERRKAREIAKQLVDGVKQKNAEELKEMDERIAHAEELREQSKETDKMISGISKELEELKNADPSDPETAKRIEELEKGRSEYMEQRGQEVAEMYAEYAVVRGMKIERLKHHDMIDAKKQGEEITDAAEKNVIGIMMEETKDKIDQDMEETKDKAEEKKEEEELQEAKIEAAREERREKEDEIRDNTEDLLELQQSQQEIQQQQTGGNLPDMKKSMEQVAGEVKLAAEDLKGLLVDKGM